MGPRMRIATLCSVLAGVGLGGLSAARAGDDYSILQGAWDCDEGGTRSSLEFLSPNQLRYNGETASYQLVPNVILVEEEYGLAQYYYQFQDGALIVFSPEGSVTQCRKAMRRAPQQPAPRQPPGAGPGALVPGPNWPPYERPAGPVSEDAPSAQALLYKFAGRWDHVTPNTLTNLYLKPDGTYAESYEAGYSGQFQDQGGHQTGNWGATGAEQSGGRWMIEGSLRQGTLTLIDGNGNRTAYRYRVHVKDGETYWGEYFFDGQLYSVKYVYR